jgi:uncharacterized membrane protein YoaK (UPF0700 family)
MVLTFATGATDAISLMALGRVFASVMTGNTVLLGVSVGQRHAAAALHAGTAFAGYSLGTLAGSRLARDQPRHVAKSRILLAMLAELAVLSGFWVGWAIARAQPGRVGQFALLGAAAVAMGVQSATVQALPGSEQPTTYLTSTLTKLLASLAVGLGLRRHSKGAGALLALLAGAVAGASLVHFARMFAPALAVGALALALLRLGFGRTEPVDPAAQ